MSCRFALELRARNVGCLRKFKTRVPDAGPIPEEQVSEIVRGLYEEFQRLTPEDIEGWVNGVRRKLEE